MNPVKRWVRDAISGAMRVSASNKIIWTPDLPIVYVDNPKCGSTTIKHSFKQAQAAKYARNGVRFRRTEEPHKADDCLKTRGLRAAACSDRFIISCVRNPFTRALSGYLDKITPENLKHFPELRGRKVDSFEQHLLAIAEYPARRLNFHLRPQHMNLDFPNIKYDAVFYLEAISELSRFFASVSPEFSVETYAPHSRSACTKLQAHYTDRAVELVQTIYAQDFERFGYSPLLQEIENVPGDCIVDGSIRGYGGKVSYEGQLRPARATPCPAFAATMRYHRLVDTLML